MPSDYEFVMPWSPSVNSCWMHTRQGVKLSKRGRQHRKDAIALLDSLNLSGELISTPVSVSIVLNPPTLRRYDVDNFSKSLLDALTHANFWVDDELVHKITIEKGVKSKDGNVNVKVNIMQ